MLEKGREEREEGSRKGGCWSGVVVLARILENTTIRHILAGRAIYGMVVKEQ